MVMINMKVQSVGYILMALMTLWIYVTTVIDAVI